MTALRAAIKAILAALLGRGQARTPTPAASSPAANSPAANSPAASSPAASSPVDSLAQTIIACATTVSGTLGTGLPEVIYENALAHELRKAGLCVCQKQSVVVRYDGMIVGDYTADLLVEDTVLIELQAVKGSDAFDTAQCANYLKATGHMRSVLLNFGNQQVSAQCMANGC